MMPERTTLSRIECGGDQWYLLCTLHDDGYEGIDLNMSDGTKAWNGSGNEIVCIQSIKISFIPGRGGCTDIGKWGGGALI